MFESDTKGWHGSYSLMGKISAESFPMILAKDKILNGPYKTKKIKDYFTTEDEVNLVDELQSEDEDIFNPKYKPPMKIKKKKLRICEPTTKKPVPEEYKYHHLNHRDMYNLNKILKAQSSQSSSIYDPKKEYVWARTLSGPQWNTLSGREKGGIFGIKNIDINFNEKKEEKDINKNDIFFRDRNIIKKQNKTMSNFYFPKKGVDMNKFGKRTTIKTIYDLRIREFRPFMKKMGPKTIRIKNMLKKLEMQAKNKLKNKKHINLNIDILEESNSSYSSDNINSNQRKKN